MANRIFIQAVVSVSVISLGLLINGCSKANNIDTVKAPDASIEREADEFGRQMASNLRHIVTQMDENGDDFNDLESIKAAAIKYSPADTRSGFGVIDVGEGELDNVMRKKASSYTYSVCVF
jgi:hypothetical protein